MKKNLLNLFLAGIFLWGFAACGSSEITSLEESAQWIAAYTPERIDMGGLIRIEATDLLRSHIDTMRSPEKVFRFSPSVKGEVRYVDGGRYIDFLPKSGSLKQGREYFCKVSLSRLTGIDSLNDFIFRFVVEKREVKLADLRVCIDPDQVDQVIVEGKMIFSLPPSDSSLNPAHLTSPENKVKATITPTADKLCHTFVIRGIRRTAEDRTVEICYHPLGEFSAVAAEAEIPGLSEFKLLFMNRYTSSQPYLNMAFSAPLAIDQELEGLITIDGLEVSRIERLGANVKVYYPRNGLSDMMVRVSDLVRSADGRSLGVEFVQHIVQEQIAPAIEIPISGTILPDGQNLKFPFRAVNLAAVDVEVVKIYTSNLMNYLQDNEIEYTGKLRRVGRLIYRQTVRLDEDKSLDLHRWQNFSIDLKNLFREEPGALYNIRLSFRQAYSLYNQAQAGEFDLLSGVTPSDGEEWDRSRPYITRMAPDYRWEEYDWSESDDPSKPSYYMSSERMPEYNLMASNIGLIVKRADGGEVWCSATDLISALPKSGVRVTAFNYQMQRIGGGYTDKNGFADFKVEGNPFIVTASKGNSTTYLKINGGHELSTSQFDVSGQKRTDGIKGFIYGERGVWRPGDEIFLTLILEDRLHTLPQNHPITLELYTPQGQLYDRQTLTQGEGSIYAFRTATTEEAPTGRWEARFGVGGQTFHHPVRIETIKPNRLKIKILSPEMLQSGEVVEVGVEAHWLTGPVAAGMEANVELSLYGNPQPFAQYPNYCFSNPLYTFSHATHEVYSGRLDSLGRGGCILSLPATPQAPGMLQANWIARVIEPGGDESLTSRSVKFAPYTSFVGIDLGPMAFETDQQLVFKLLTVDPLGAAVERNLTYKIYRLDWSWWWEGSANDLSRYVESTTAEVVASGEIQTRKGKGELDFCVEYPSWGKYLIYVEDPVSGHATGGVIEVDWPAWRGHADKNDPKASTMLSFALDKSNYEVGEVAAVYLPKSAGGQVLLSIENGSRLISRQWIHTSSDRETVCKIPVTREMAPNFYIHATLLQPHAQTLNDLPIRMYGVQGAQVYDHRTILHPEIDLPSEILPQQPFTVSVKERDGKPMSYTLAIVDEGLLDITAYQTPDPWSAMNRREALGVRTWDMFDDVIGAYGGTFSSILSIGGDEALRRAAGKEKRFNPVVKYLGPFTLTKGTKKHKITLPMYVGSVRVMVVAAHQGSYGSSDKTVAVRAPLMLLTSLPRKLNCGDRLRMPINLFVSEKQMGEVKVSVRVEGPLSVAGDSSKRVIFNDPAEKMVEFELACDKLKAGKAKIVVTALGGGKEVSETLWIEVSNPLPDQIESRLVELPAGQEFTYEWEPFSQGRAELMLATMPLIDFRGLFETVTNYAHYCTEQLAARAMYLLYARQFLQSAEQQSAEKSLEPILKTILARQISSGGFAYWPGQSNAHDWVSSMVGEVLTEARRQGFKIPYESFDKWKSYQHAAARAYSHTTLDGADLGQAYRLYTLVNADEQPTASMNKLRESKDLSRSALLRLAAAYSLLGRSDVVKTLMARLEEARYTKGSYATFWSPLRDQAMELEAYMLMGDRVKAFSLAQQVVATFSATASSTQEIAFVSAAMARFSTPKDDRACEVSVAEEGALARNIRDLFGVMSLAVRPESGRVRVSNKAQKPIYLSLMTARRPTADTSLSAVEKRCSLRISYTDLHGKPISIAEIRQGVEFQAVVEVKMGDHQSPSMALTFPIASGWEIWNERLVGGGASAEAHYTDVRDDRINWYFSAEKGESKRFKVRLRAAYTGLFTLPPVLCEDMYDISCRAQGVNGKTEVR